ncbi:MAG TPA: ABC transporter ATP-binding protein [Tepidisphaeraceae bacterium]|jgi:lipoprotein-releasing system ATP-binding protein
MSQSTAIPRPAATTDAILRAHNVHRAFKMGDSTVAVLKGVDLTLRPGEFVAIEGRSGSGKSTLLHILGGLDSLDAGSLEFAGQNYTHGADRSRDDRWYSRVAHPAILIALLLGSLVADVVSIRPFARAVLVAGGILAIAVTALLVWLLRNYAEERPITHLRNTQFGFVFQFYHLLPELNVLENTMLAAMIERSWFGFRSHRRDLVERATRLLDQVGLSHRLRHRPSQLSGGERQRVAIARALMNDPRVLFADEPTGNLDADTGRQIMNLLEQLHRDQNQTIVMVTHDRALAREADRVLVLKDGKLEKAD